MGELILITGGARSGKSRFAERLASEAGSDVIYFATLQPADDEMRRRVESHRRSRPPTWRTVEEPVDVVGALARAGAFDACVFDCLTLWVSNMLFLEGDDAMERERSVTDSILDRVTGLVESAREHAGTLIVVTNETGSGVVPDQPLGRLFRDVLGEANQVVAAAATRAYLCVAGYAVDVKQAGISIRDKTS